MPRKPADPSLTKVTPLPPTRGPAMPPKSKPAKPANPAVEPPKAGTALVSYKDRMAALVAQTKKAEAPAGGFLSTKGGRLSNGDVRLPGDMIRAIVIDYRKDNEFYENAYEQGKSAAPVCGAVVRPYEVLSPWRMPREGEDVSQCEMIDEATGYVSDMPKPQVAPGFGCDSCHMLDWGSAKLIKGKTGSGKGKACRESRRLHIFAADQCTNPDDVSRAPYMTMIPPPTSLDNFKRFANEVTEVLGMPIFGAVVEISVQPHDQYQFMVHYKLIEAIRDDGLLMALLQRHEQISAKTIVLPKMEDDKATQDARGSKF